MTLPRELASRDPDGTPVIGVQLTNRAARAWITAADFAAVQREIGDAAWFANAAQGREYVRAYHPRTHRNVTIARIITGDIARVAITYRNGDSFDLRQRNLVLSWGAGGCPKKPRATTTQRKEQSDAPRPHLSSRH